MASRYVVTAAHCVAQYNNDMDEPLHANQVTVWVGLYGDTKVRHKKVGVSNVMVHSEYFWTGMNDIAVLELSEGLDLNIYTPACMARTSEVKRFEGMEAEFLIIRDDQDSNRKGRKNQRLINTTVIEARHCYNRFHLLRATMNDSDAESLTCALKYDADFVIKVGFSTSN